MDKKLKKEIIDKLDWIDERHIDPKKKPLIQAIYICYKLNDNKLPESLRDIRLKE
jgi:hypothetical protein